MQEAGGRAACFQETGNDEGGSVKKNTNTRRKKTALRDGRCNAPMGEASGARSLGLSALGLAGLSGRRACRLRPSSRLMPRRPVRHRWQPKAPTAENSRRRYRERGCDVVVVGLGTGGLVAASAAAKEGARSSASIARPPWAPRMPRYCWCVSRGIQPRASVRQPPDH